MSLYNSSGEATIAEKLEYLGDIKTAIKNAIINKGVDVSASTPFMDYADKIGTISGGIQIGSTIPSSSQGSDGDLYLMQEELPNNITFVEYLQSSGTQYIDTGVVVTEGLGMYTTGIFRGVNQWSFGARNANDINNSTVALVSSAGNTSTKYCFKSFGSKRDYTTNKYNVAINGTYEESIKMINTLSGPYAVQEAKGISMMTQFYKTESPTLNNYSIILFGVNTSGTITKATDIAIGRVVFYNWSDIIKDYLACLDSNNVPCMYEAISGTFVYNDGTGDFTYGSEVTPVVKNTLYLKQNGSWVAIANDVDIA